jgi:hypothetical protein
MTARQRLHHRRRVVNLANVAKVGRARLAADIDPIFGAGPEDRNG